MHIIYTSHLELLLEVVGGGKGCGALSKDRQHQIVVVDEKDQLFAPVVEKRGHSKDEIDDLVTQSLQALHHRRRAGIVQHEQR